MTSVVVDTDYDSYYIRFVCEVSSDGKCTSTSPEVDIWSRNKRNPREILQKAQTKIQQLCVNTSAFIDVKIGQGYMI